MTDFGKGPLLKDACPWLRDRAARIERILDVTERNSVIEGLPRLDEETKRRLREQLAAMSGPPATPREPPQPSVHNPS